MFSFEPQVPPCQIQIMSLVYLTVPLWGLNEMTICFHEHLLRMYCMPGLLLSFDVWVSCKELPIFKIVRIIFYFQILSNFFFLPTPLGEIKDPIHLFWNKLSSYPGKQKKWLQQTLSSKTNPLMASLCHCSIMVFAINQRASLSSALEALGTDLAPDWD